MDPTLSKAHWHAHDHTSEDKIAPGTIVRLEIGIWAAAMQFEPDEQLVLKISGHQMTLAEFEPLRGTFQTGNKGKHIVHFGADCASHIQIPIVPV